MHSRRLLINQCFNMRELGGFPTVDDKITAWNKIIRSSAPFLITDKGIEYLIRYGVRKIIDLRWKYQIDKKPTPFTNSSLIPSINIPLVDETQEIPDTDYHPMTAYPLILKTNNKIAEILRSILETDGAVLFHCAWGKDRTGIVAAILLLLLQVPEEDVIADYASTYPYVEKIIKPYELMTNEGFARTEPEWIKPMLDCIRENGGIDCYLNSIGFTYKEQQKLYNKLIDSGGEQ